jgi:hypothetical protein
LASRQSGPQPLFKSVGDRDITQGLTHHGIDAMRLFQTLFDLWIGLHRLRQRPQFGQLQVSATGPATIDPFG